MLRRVDLIDVLTCPTCRGRGTLLAAIREQDSIRRILEHLGLLTEPPTVASARPPSPAGCKDAPLFATECDERLPPRLA
jgi:uncharacterized protein YbaR (Trm112 family)